MAVNTRNNIVTNGLVLCLDAANRISYVSGSTTWRDLSGTSNNNTLVASPAFSTDGGGSIVFDGSTKRATLASPFGQAGFTTVSIWYNRVEAVSSTTWRTLFATTFTNIHHLISQDPTRVLGIWDGSFKSFSYTPLIDGKFHNYTVVYQSATNATLYVDGIFVSTIATILNLSTSPIGSIGNWGGGNYWAGYLNLPLIYNRALSQQEIVQNYNATKARFGLL
jgi:hypothetical protein